MSDKNTGKEYEKIVAAIHRQFSDKAIVTENEKIKGKSGKPRQIDITIRSQIIGYDVLIIVQCKDYKRKVDIEKVDSLIGTLDDVGAAKGILVSDSGFTIGAIDRAKEDGRIDLSSVVDVENEKLRARIRMPVCGEIVGVTSFQMTINETSKMRSIIDAQILNEAKRRFASLWNKNILPSGEGNNEYKDVLIDTPEQRREIIYHYTVEKRSYFKDIEIQSGAGIYNAIDGSFRTKSITTERIDFQDISNWPRATEEQIERATFRLVLYAGLPELDN